MNINDIFEIVDENEITAKVTQFIPNHSDEELQEILSQMMNGLYMKANTLSALSQKEFGEHKNEISVGLFDDFKNIEHIIDNFMALRKLTRKIQTERDTLVDYVTREVYQMTAKDR